MGRGVPLSPLPLQPLATGLHLGSWSLGLFLSAFLTFCAVFICFFVRQGHPRHSYSSHLTNDSRQCLFVSLLSPRNSSLSKTSKSLVVLFFSGRRLRQKKNMYNVWPGDLIMGSGRWETAVSLRLSKRGNAWPLLLQDVPLVFSSCSITDGPPFFIFCLI